MLVIVVLLAVLATLAPATPAAAATRDRRVYFLGDSVMHGAHGALRDRLPGWPLTINTFVGRFLHHGLDTLREERAKIHGAAVIHLGNNYLGNRRAFAEQLDEAMRILRDVDEVVWVTTRNRSDGMAPVNEELRAVARRWRNASVAEWGPIAEGDERLTWNDGTHLTPKGQRAYADLLGGHLVDWLSPTDRCRQSTNPPAQPSDDAGRGYWLLADDGTVRGYGVPAHGDLSQRKVTARPVSIAATPKRDGYWILDERGGVHAFGAATFHGGLGERRLNGPPRRIVAAPGGGYWVVGTDGGVFSFGPARFHGSTGDRELRAPITSMAAAPQDGYWLVGGDGGVFTFGGARFHGSTGERQPAPDIAAMTASSAGGYWLWSPTGGVFAFGSAGFHGSLPGLGFCHPPKAVQLLSTTTGAGYWMVTRHGDVYSFGDAPYRGGTPNLSAGVRIVDAAAG